jgi:glycosyltransferase involved in cell wall biosynthesis
VPQVVTVHDLAFERLPGHFDRAYRTFAHYCHRAAARRATAVICVSETTARDVTELWGVPAERIVIAAHGPGQELPPSRPPRRSESDPYFLYVGDDEPRKNLATLLAGYARYRTETAAPQALVLAGTPGRAPSQPGVHYEQHPSPERLAQLYAGATALVHPALYEGFGMTPLEAMRLGTPVIAAAAPALTEICGNAARYIDPRDAHALAGALAELADNQTLRGELAARGKNRAATYSWATSARRHLDAYSLARTR